jgi:hypothetical protein
MPCEKPIQCTRKTLDPGNTAPKNRECRLCLCLAERQYNSIIPGVRSHLRIVDARIFFRGGRCRYNDRGGGSEISMCCELTSCLSSTMSAWIPSCFASIAANAGLKRSSSFLVKSQQMRCARPDVTLQPFHLQYDI